MSSTEVGVRPGEAGPLPFIAEDAFAAVERAFPPERREQLSRFLNIQANDPAFVPFLAISAAYQLNPMLGEIWLIPKQERENVNGQWVTTGVKYSPMIGRDGLLSRARRDPSYLGHKFGVVCENDEFIVEENPDDDFLAKPRVFHRFSGSRARRGRVMGAWCYVGMRNRPYTFYYADVTEHGRMKTRNGERSWDGAWSYTSAMIAKSAISYAHRLALGITGVIPIDELSPADRAEYGLRDEVEDGESDESRLKDVWRFVEEATDEGIMGRLARGTKDWPVAKIEMTFSGRTPDALRVLADEIAPIEGSVVAEDAPESGENPPEKPSDDEPGEEDRIDEGEVPTGPEDDRLDERRVDEASALRRRLGELEGAHAVAEPGSAAAQDILDEMDSIEARLREIAGEDPEQESLL